MMLSWSYSSVSSEEHRLACGMLAMTAKSLAANLRINIGFRHAANRRQRLNLDRLLFPHHNLHSFPITSNVEGSHRGSLKVCGKSHYLSADPSDLLLVV
ncbi:hypothetical protein BV22DRAFT_925009 [Leucogyrophana mollusca]|uniref:Uncharacterized protein n=1 Tax=Leucogyrophana mollusca TaxID=85980 RepID=A0ACB8AYE2_9AGAM|nr:hypothetical protein BV22DRAFT_925009 [Leucogyrophana mollusca]